jgi:hypothetical protein
VDELHERVDGRDESRADQDYAHHLRHDPVGQGLVELPAGDQSRDQARNVPGATTKNTALPIAAVDLRMVRHGV